MWYGNCFTNHEQETSKRRSDDLRSRCGEEDAHPAGQLLPIKKGKNHVGIVTDTDLVRKDCHQSRRGQAHGRAGDDVPLCTIESNQDVDDAQDMMGDLGVRHLAVTKGGLIVGGVGPRSLDALQTVCAIEIGG